MPMPKPNSTIVNEKSMEKALSETLDTNGQEYGNSRMLTTRTAST
jgi:hypothetical protein